MAQRLKAWRERRGLTQEQLAQRAKVSRITIARLETGRADVRVSALLKLARALRCTLDDLAGK